MENKVGQLNLSGWFLEEEKQTEETINHLRRVLGTFHADSDSTCNYMRGYLSGLKAMYRKYEDQPHD